MLTERNLDTTKWPKMDITNCRSMELLKRLGVADSLRAIGKWAKVDSPAVRFVQQLSFCLHDARIVFHIVLLETIQPLDQDLFAIPSRSDNGLMNALFGRCCV